MSQLMPLDPSVLAVLRPAIMQILENADLSSISAKRVRAQLSQLPPGTFPSPLDVASNKKQIDEVIRDCFDQISKSLPVTPQPTSHNGGSSAPPSTGLALPGLGGVRGSHSSAQNKSSSTSSIRAGSSKTLNGSDTKAKTDSTAPKPKKAPKKRSRPADDEDDDGTKKKRASNPNNPFNRPLLLSPLMAEVCGGDEMPRHAVVKQLWAYIKGNNLQNEENKRQIMCDDKLTRLFKKDSVDSFEMAKLIGVHLTKKEEPASAPPTA